MDGRFRLAIAILSLASVALASTAGAAASSAPAKATPNSPKDAPSTSPPMVFFLAKGEPNACGPGCSEWIAADGRFDLDTPDRLRALLKRLGGRKLPVYFRTPGGFMRSAMAVGRLMREHKLQAGVATTIPQGCSPPALSHLVTELDTDACLALKRSGGVLVSKFNTELTRCASACVYALAGGIVRDIPISAQIFVHAGIVVTVNKKTGKVTRRLRDDELSAADRAKSKSEDLELVSYLRQMGVDPALFYAAQKVSNDTSRALTRKEIADFGIDSRTVVEGAWQATTTDVAKRMIERKGRETEYHQKTFRFRCSGEGHVSVQYLSPVLDSTEVGHFHEIKARIADGEFTLVPLPALNEARLPTAFFKRVLAADHIALNEMADETQANKPTRSFRLSTAGLAAPLAALLERCDSSPPALNTPKTSASAQSTNVSNNANPSTLLNPPITRLKWEVPKPDVPGRAMADEKE